MQKTNKKHFDYLLLLIGILCITYLILLLMNMSFTTFLIIYPIIALLCFSYAIIELKTKASILAKIPLFLRCLILSLCGAMLILFIVLEGLIITQGEQNYHGKSDYIIILGAQINGNKISLSLKYRLDAGLELYKKNPDAIFVVSGGKGAKEQKSEAQFMYDYLSEHGVSEQQIIMEDRSTNTYENLLFSKQLLDQYTTSDDYEVTIVTNAFHTYRSKYLAEKIGFNANTYGAKMHTISIPNFYIREFFGLIKDMALNR